MRHDLNGRGAPAVANAAAYALAFPAADADMGCANICAGYELTDNLDFDENGDDQMTAAGDPTYWNGGMGWEPIAASSASPFRATLRGNRHSIANLYLRRGAGASASASYHSLLGALGSSGRVESLALTDVDILTTSPTRFVGGVAGLNNGVITQSYVSGAISAGGSSLAGGIAGQSNGSVTASFNRATVVGSTPSQVGGIAGRN